MYQSFYTKHTKIILDSIKFTNNQVGTYYGQLTHKHGIHADKINQERDKIINKLKNVRIILSDYPDFNAFQMRKQEYSEMMDIVRSSLENYREDLQKVLRDEPDLNGLKTTLTEINEIINYDILKNANSALYSKFSGTHSTSSKVNCFMSYSNKDKQLAGKLAKLLEQKSQKQVIVFLAHHTIEGGRKWRDEIKDQLEKSQVLLALMTPNFKESVWTHQEFGFVLGRKEKKIIPLAIKEVKNILNQFGFLEEVQHIDIDEANLEKSINEILKLIFK